MIDHVNRTLAMILGLLLIAAGAGLIGSALFIAGPYAVTLSAGEQWNVSRLSPADQTLTVAIGLLLALAGLFIVALELLGPPRQRHLLVSQRDGRRVLIERQATEQHLQEALAGVQGLRSVSISMFQARGTVEIRQHLTVSPNATIPALTEHAVQIVTETASRQLGLTLGKVETVVRLARREAPGRDVPTPETPPQQDSTDHV